MPFDLVPDGGADKVGAIGVKAVLDQQIDMAEIDIAEVDGDLLGFATALRSQLMYIVRHLLTIHNPSTWMVNGPADRGCKALGVIAGSHGFRCSLTSHGSGWGGRHPASRTGAACSR